MHTICFALTCICFSINSLFDGEKQASSEQLTEQIFDGLLENFVEVRFKFNLNGGIEQYFLNSVENAVNKRRLFYEENINLEEIDAVDYQEIEISALLKRWKNGIESQLETITKSKSQKSRRDEYLNLLEKDKAFENEVFEILLPHQKKILRQTHMRYALRMSGFYRFLSNAAFREAVGFTNADVREIRHRFNRKKREFAKKVIELKNDFVEKILECLNDDEADRLVKKWPYLESGKYEHIELLRVHLFSALDEIDQKKTKSENADTAPEKLGGVTNENVCLNLINVPHFKLHVDGCVVRAKPVNTVSKSDIPRITVQTFFSLYDSNLVEKLNISQFQDSHLQALHEALEMNQAGKLSFAAMSSSSPEAIAELKRYKSTQARFFADKFRELQRLLSSEQWHMFEDTLDGLISKTRGPLYDLIYGQLGKDFELTQSRKETIIKTCTRVLRNIDEQSTKIESQAISSFLDTYGDNKKAKSTFRNLIGPEIKKSPANLQLLINSL